MDDDLKNKKLEEVKEELLKLRNGIRYHRDQKGDDRCWLDDVELYKLLPEQRDADFTLPPKDEFARDCARFWQSRQPNPVNELKVDDKTIQDSSKLLIDRNNSDGKIHEFLAKFIAAKGLYFEADAWVKAEKRKT